MPSSHLPWLSLRDAAEHLPDVVSPTLAYGQLLGASEEFPRLDEFGLYRVSRELPIAVSSGGALGEDQVVGL